MEIMNICAAETVCRIIAAFFVSKRIRMVTAAMQVQEIKNLLNTRHLDEAERIIMSSKWESAVLLPLRINLLFLRRNYKEALALVEQMLNENPDSAIAYRWKAEILDDGFHDYKTSVECSSKAIILDPSYAEAYVIRGNTKRWMNPADNEGAIDDYNQALKYDKNNSSAYSGIGWALLAMPGKLNEALQKFTTALCCDSNSYAAYQGISSVFFKKNQLDKAIEYINKAIEINPDAYYLYNTRAYYKKALGEPPVEEVFDDCCIAFQKISCKKDFDFKSFFDAAYTSGKMEKAAELLWRELDNLPKREDIFTFHSLLVCNAEDELLNLILTKGLPAEYQSPSGKIWFHELLVMCEKCEDIKKIPISKNLLRKVNEEGLTPLGVAVKINAIDIGKYLLSAGSSADEFIASPWMTPFAMAIQLNKNAWVELFLESGADVNLPLKKNGSYLTLACRLKHWEIAQTLLEHGADPNHLGLTGDMLPLCYCDPRDNMEIVKKMLAKGAKLEYARSLAEPLLEKRREKLKCILSGTPVNQETFNDFFAYLDIKSISEKERKIIQKAVQEKRGFSYDENLRFAIRMSESCQSSITWPKEDAYSLVSIKLPPAPKEKPEKEEKATSTEQGCKKDQSKANTSSLGMALFIFIPLWISTKSFVTALLITAVFYIVLYIIKSVMGGSSQ